MPSPLFLLLLPLLHALPTPSPPPLFIDHTLHAGIHQPGPRHKWGGPIIADVNSDGIYDIFLTFHHDARVQLWMGSPNGTFSRNLNFDHRLWDVHGLSVGPVSATSRDRLVVLCMGGGNGANLSPPSVYKVGVDGGVVEVGSEYGFGGGRGRGRTAVFMDMVGGGRAGALDLLYLSYLGEVGSNVTQFAYENRASATWRLRKVRGLEGIRRGRSEVTDVDGDGVMELVSLREMRVLKRVAPFRMAEITEDVIPSGLVFDGLRVSSVAEGDFDNDGDMDLYVARTNRSLITNRDPLRGAGGWSDKLLVNVGGRYEDGSEMWRIPFGGKSQGVTVGDLDNDGWLDVVVMRYWKRDLVLMNNGDGTFRRVWNRIPKSRGSVGNHAVAFDYDGDGRLDVMVGHGERNRLRGVYRLMRNVTPRRGRHWLKVRVLNSPMRQSTCLHAVVQVIVEAEKRGGRRRGERMVMTRRVGSVGAQAAGGSFLDTVHFGVGRRSRVKNVKVRWVGGEVVWRRNVKVDQTLTIGVH